MIGKIKGLLQKHKELLLYLVFGVLTTLVNFMAFAGLEAALGTEKYLISNAVAWIVAVVFAYITNKLFVFASVSFAPGVLAREMGEFFLARIFSFFVEELGLWLLVDTLGIGAFSAQVWGFLLSGQMLAKAALAVIVVIMNYFFSKFIIFKNKKQ